MSDGVTRHTAEEAGVKSVLTALDLLDCFTVAEELGVSDVARRLPAVAYSKLRPQTRTISVCAQWSTFGCVYRDPQVHDRNNI